MSYSYSFSTKIFEVAVAGPEGGFRGLTPPPSEVVFFFFLLVSI